MNAHVEALPDWVVQLWAYQPVLLVLSTVFGGFYVYFTIRTFQQIRRQTELQSEAFLIVAAQKVPTSREAPYSFDPAAVELHRKWRDILQRNIPNTMQPDKWLILKFTNRGRADIVDWTVDVTAHVLPGEYLSESCNVRDEVKRWRVRYQSHKDVVPTESAADIQVPVAIIGAFPRIELDWTIVYKDTRGVEYKKFGGDSRAEDVNAFALAHGSTSIRVAGS
jgi:hypothetical protein